MAQTNPFDQFDVPNEPLPSPPKVTPAPTPLQESAEARAAEKAERDRIVWEATHNPDGTLKESAAKPTESERTAAFLATRVASSSRQLADAITVDPDAQSPNLGVEMVRGIFGSTAANYLTDEQRQQVENAQLDIIDAALTLGTGAAYTAEQLQTYRRSYFPQLGDSEATIADKQTRLRALLESARVKAGNSSADIDRAVAAIFPDQASAEDGESPPAIGGAEPPQNIPGVGGTGEAPVLDPEADTKTISDPALAGIRDKYIGLLQSSASPQEVVAFLESVGVTDPGMLRQARAQAAYRRRNPNVPLNEYTFNFTKDVPLTDAERAAARAADSPAGAFAVNAGDAFTGFNLDSIIGATGGNAERARLTMGEIGERHPIASTVGTIGGGVAAALGLEAPISGIIARNVPRALTADSLYGMAAGAGATDYGEGGQSATVADRFIGAGKGGVAGLAGSYLGSKTGSLLQRTARGVSDPSVAALQAEGIPMTVGQTLSRSGKAGAAIKGFEDRVAGLPVVGDMINARRAEGVQRFNATAFNKALEPIGGTVGEVVGEEAVEQAQTQVSEAFRSALAGKGAVPDQAFADDLAEAVGKVRSIKRLGDEVTDQIGEILQPYADEALLSGEALDDISRSLRALRSAYSADPLAIPVAKRLDRVEKVIFDLFDRQAEGTIPAYQAARQAYRRLSVLEDSVLKAKNTEGVFTPAQLGLADRTNTVRFGGKRTAARGGGAFHDLQRSAQNVLPSKVPDSGTAGRVLIPLALVGGGAGADAAGGGGAGFGLTIGSILAALYSRTGQRLLTKPGRGMKPGTKRKAVLESDKTRRAISVGSGASAAALTTQQ